MQYQYVQYVTRLSEETIELFSVYLKMLKDIGNLLHKTDFDFKNMNFWL